jgi:predicted RNA-binding Zn-ribbon protein involved in translation (DUF1610 family)
MNIAASDIKSRPTYAPLRPEATAARHLLVLEAGAIDAATWSELGKAFAAVAASLDLAWVGPACLAAWPTPVRTQGLADRAVLAEWLGQFGPLRVNDRLYVQGTEPFVWAVAALASSHGLAPDQIRLAHAGSLRRRVWCTHCHCLTEDVTTQVVPCAGCGRHLLVRDHFSRRHGAFMGVMVDAEVPGQRPAPEEMFP